MNHIGKYKQGEMAQGNMFGEANYGSSRQPALKSLLAVLHNYITLMLFDHIM